MNKPIELSSLKETFGYSDDEMKIVNEILEGILNDDEYQIDNKLNNSNQYLYICRCGVLLSRYRENRNAAFLLEYKNYVLTSKYKSQLPE
mgnify:CR=1 FL=1